MNKLFLLEFLIFDGAALTWGAYEIWSVRRSRWPDDPKERPDDAKEKMPAPSENAPRHPER